MELTDVLYGAIGPLIGVIVGYSLAQFSSWKESRKRSNHVKRAILHELSVVHKVLTEVLGRDRLSVPAYEHPFITVTYDSLRTEIASTVSVETLAKIQSAYRFIPKLNEPLPPPMEGGGRGNFNIFAFHATTGSTDRFYISRDGIVQVTKLVKEAMDALSGELGETV